MKTVLKTALRLFGRTLALLLLPAPLCTPLHASAQQVSGRVTDERGTPVAGVAVIMQRLDSLYVQGTVTDSLGRFAIADDTRPYRLLLHHLSYRSRTVESSDDDAGVIVLSENPLAVNEVTVRGRRPLVTASDGKLSYDVGQLVRNRPAGNAWEAVAALPGVREEGESLVLAGSSGVTLLLDGRPTTMTPRQLAALLRSMPAEQVERAEVMYDTPPRYRVHGASINIVTRRSRTRRIAGRLHGTYTARHDDEAEAGGSLLLATPRTQIDLLYGYTSVWGRPQRLDMHALHRAGDRIYDISQRQRTCTDGRKQTLRAALSTDLRDSSTLRAAYAADFTPGAEITARSKGTFVESRTASRQRNAMHNLSLRYTTPGGTDLNADYTRYRATDHSEMANRRSDAPLSAFRTRQRQSIHRLSLDAGRTRTLGRGWSLDYGAGFLFARSDDSQHYTTLQGEELSGNDVDSRIDEYTGSLYAGTSRTLASGRGSLSLTAEGEYYSRGDYRRWALYPQASFNWMFSSDHILQAGLSTDKNYPSYWEMAAGVSYLDGYAELHGTPGLHPMRQWSLSAVYILKQRYVFQLFWLRTPDFFAQTVWMSPEEPVLVYQTLNFDFRRMAGLSITAPFPSGKRFDSRFTLQAFRMRMRSDDFHGAAFDRRRWVASLHWSGSVKLSARPALSLSADAFCQSPAIQGTYTIRPAWSVDAGAKLLFSRERGELTLKWQDIFSSAVPEGKIDFLGQRFSLKSGALQRRVSVGFAWRFGNYQERERKEPDTSRFGH